MIGVLVHYHGENTEVTDYELGRAVKDNPEDDTVIAEIHIIFTNAQ